MEKNEMLRQEEIFIRAALDRPVALVGMMGAGKSHLGKPLAERLGRSFADTDSMVESGAGLSIPEVFALYGETRFRKAEKKAVAEAVEQGAGVIATGGGALIAPETLDLLKEKSWMIWLDVDPDILWERIREAGNRPLLKTENPKDRLLALMKDRKPLYAQAHIHLRIGEEDRDACLERILKALSETLKGARLRS